MLQWMGGWRIKVASGLSKAPQDHRAYKEPLDEFPINKVVIYKPLDDSLLDRKLIERLLVSSGCKVTTAENLQRALEILGLGDGQRRNNNVPKVNMIITDYCMPGMTMYELFKKIKESSYLREIPVVVVSSKNVLTLIKKCMEEGAHEFMLKPLMQSDMKKLRSHMTKN